MTKGVINIFLNKDFTFNNKYSADLGVSIITFDNSLFNNTGLEYKINIETEHNLSDYNPYYSQQMAEIDNVELDLLIYNPITMQPLKIEQYDMEELYDWLITDDFVQFISDDEPDIIYYFKTISITKMFTFNGYGYLKVVFKPYSNYRYKRVEYQKSINGDSTIEIDNLSKLAYPPIIEITNRGNTKTVNKVNGLEVTGLEYLETVIIDNLSKLVQSENGENKFSVCNRRWVTLNANSNNTITLQGRMTVKIICEFPILY